MPSNSWGSWSTVGRAALDQIAAAHTAVGGSGRGRRFATHQINHAYAVLLSSQWQRYCRDLHSEAVDHLLSIVTVPALSTILREQLTSNRKLDAGNPNPGNLGNDFGRLGLDLWPALAAHDPANRGRNQRLTALNAWRNAIAHQDFDPVKLRTRSLRLSVVRGWRLDCARLAVDMDVVVAAHVGSVIGHQPW